MVVGTGRSLGGYEPDLRYRSNDADVQLDGVSADRNETAGGGR